MLTDFDSETRAGQGSTYVSDGNESDSSNEQQLDSEEAQGRQQRIVDGENDDTLTAAEFKRVQREVKEEQVWSTWENEAAAGDAAAAALAILAAASRTQAKTAGGTTTMAADTADGSGSGSGGEEGKPGGSLTEDVEFDDDDMSEGGGRNRMTVVGIGASAGGLDAIREFFCNLPRESCVGLDVCFLVVQHLSPTFKSMMVEILRKFCWMEVRSVTDGMRVERHTIYCIPASYEMYVTPQYTLRLHKRAHSGHELFHPVTLLFKSMGANLGPNVVGVILSGTGSDGALGLGHLKEAGGLVFCQDPATAAFDGMPQAALATGRVDFALPPSLMWSQYLMYRAHCRGVPDERQPTAVGAAANGSTSTPGTPAGVQACNIQDVVHCIESNRNMDFSSYKQTTIRRRINHRMGVLRLRDYGEYVQRLQLDPAEVDALFLELLIPVTEFFRDPETWEIMAMDILPPLVRSHPNGVRVWVPACCTGEEVYTIAMLLVECFEQETGFSFDGGFGGGGTGGGASSSAVRQSLRTRMPRPCPIHIIASDVDVSSLDIAKAGRYPRSIASNVSRARLSRFFVPMDTGFKVCRMLRDMVLFSHHNVCSQPPFHRIDFLSCRNLLIYFKKETQNHMFRNWSHSLTSKGILLLGSSESVPNELGKLFSVIDRKHAVYRCIARAKRPPLVWAPAPVVGLPMTASRGITGGGGGAHQHRGGAAGSRGGGNAVGVRGHRFVLNASSRNSSRNTSPSAGGAGGIGGNGNGSDGGGSGAEGSQAVLEDMDSQQQLQQHYAATGQHFPAARLTHRSGTAVGNGQATSGERADMMSRVRAALQPGRLHAVASETFADLYSAIVSAFAELCITVTCDYEVSHMFGNPQSFVRTVGSGRTRLQGLLAQELVAPLARAVDSVFTDQQPRFLRLPFRGGHVNLELRLFCVDMQVPHVLVYFRPRPTAAAVAAMVPRNGNNGGNKRQLANGDGSDGSPVNGGGSGSGSGGSGGAGDSGDSSQWRRPRFMDEEPGALGRGVDAPAVSSSSNEEVEYLRMLLSEVAEKLETSTEELQATNEELMASNEELQATNEELQSVNEELMTVNTEHQLKIEELEGVQQDMSNLLNCSAVPTLILNQDLTIRRFTKPMLSLIRLRQGDVGRAVTELSHSLEHCKFEKDVARMLATASPVRREVFDRELQLWYRMEVLPFMSERGAIFGAVISFTDITQLRGAVRDSMVPFSPAAVNEDAYLQMVPDLLLVLESPKTGSMPAAAAAAGDSAGGGAQWDGGKEAEATAFKFDRASTPLALADGSVAGTGNGKSSGNGGDTAAVAGTGGGPVSPATPSSASSATADSTPTATATATATRSTSAARSCRVKFVSQSSESVLGLTPLEVMRLGTARRLVHPADMPALEKLLEADEELLVRPKLISVRMRMKQLGEWVPLELHVRCRMRDAGTAVFVVVGRDVTVRLEAEAAAQATWLERESELSRERVSQQSNRAKQGYVSMTAHDLRTPIAAVQMATEMLLSERRSLTAQQLEWLTTIRYASEILTSTVQNIMNYSHLMEGKSIPSVMGTVNFPRLVRKCERIITAYGVNSHVSVSVDIADDVPRYIVTDGAWVSQMIINLLSNARKFTPEGSITVRCRVVTNCPQGVDVQLPRSRSGRFLFVEVADTGIGVPPEQLGKLFRPYSQLHSDHGGTGLGLYTVRQQVKALHGSCGVRPNAAGMAGLSARSSATRPPPSGTVFWFCIPCEPGKRLADTRRAKPSAGGPAGAAGAKGAARRRKQKRGGQSLTLTVDNDDDGDDVVSLSSPSGGGGGGGDGGGECSSGGSSDAQSPSLRPLAGCTALVLEDVKMNRTLVVSMLERAGATCDWAANGKEGLAKMKARLYDVVFCGLQMAIMNGYMCVEALREWEAAQDGAPRRQRVVACTSSIMTQKEQLRTAEAGFDGVLIKPARTDAMVAYFPSARQSPSAAARVGAAASGNGTGSAGGSGNVGGSVTNGGATVSAPPPLTPGVMAATPGSSGAYE